MAGLQFQQLPATQASPEDDMRNKIESGRKAKIYLKKWRD